MLQSYVLISIAVTFAAILDTKTHRSFWTRTPLAIALRDSSNCLDFITYSKKTHIKIPCTQWLQQRCCSTILVLVIVIKNYLLRSKKSNVKRKIIQTWKLCWWKGCRLFRTKLVESGNMNSATKACVKPSTSLLIDKRHIFRGPNCHNSEWTVLTSETLPRTPISSLKTTTTTINYFCNVLNRTVAVAK